MSKKKKAEEVEEEEVAPFWMISFSDMMSLLLSFFVLLFSMSTIEKEKMTAVMEAMGSRYLSVKPHGDKEAAVKIPDAPPSTVPSVTPPVPLLRPQSVKEKPISGTTIFFAPGSEQIDDDSKQLLARLADQLKGMPYTIMVKGHASKQEVAPAAPNAAYQKVDDLAYARAWNVRDYMISFGLKPELFQLVELGSHKPLKPDEMPMSSKVNPNAYVEVIQVKE
ncbi:hypothetical protein FACS1894170_09460 [Planctomycetales bacterium]|nr:hypothetical protein FACS1894170_09460 [Planctomycetales bacterium]